MEWPHICILTGGWYHCTKRQTNNQLSDGQENHSTFCSSRKTYACHYIMERQIYPIPLGTTSLYSGWREQHGPMEPQTGQSVTSSLLMAPKCGIMLTIGPTQCHCWEEGPAVLVGLD